MKDDGRHTPIDQVVLVDQRFQQLMHVGGDFTDLKGLVAHYNKLTLDFDGNKLKLKKDRNHDGITSGEGEESVYITDIEGFDSLRISYLDKQGNTRMAYQIQHDAEGYFSYTPDLKGIKRKPFKGNIFTGGKAARLPFDGKIECFQGRETFGNESISHLVVALEIQKGMARRTA